MDNLKQELDPNETKEEYEKRLAAEHKAYEEKLVRRLILKRLEREKQGLAMPSDRPCMSACYPKVDVGAIARELGSCVCRLGCEKCRPAA